MSEFEMFKVVVENSRNVEVLNNPQKLHFCEVAEYVKRFGLGCEAKDWCELFVVKIYDDCVSPNVFIGETLESAMQQAYDFVLG